jgi:hypothetical protein
MRGSRSRSWLSLAGWFSLGPFVVVAGLALLVLGFGFLAIVMRAIATLLHAAGV